MPYGHSYGKTSVQLNKHLAACSSSPSASSARSVPTRKFHSDFSCSTQCSGRRHSSARSRSSSIYSRSGSCSSTINRSASPCQLRQVRSAAAAAAAATAETAAVAGATTHATAAWVDVNSHVNKRQNVDYCVLRGNYARSMSVLDSSHRASTTLPRHSS